MRLYIVSVNTPLSFFTQNFIYFKGLREGVDVHCHHQLGWTPLYM